MKKNFGLYYGIGLLLLSWGTSLCAAPKVIDLVLVSEKRISRTVYDYTYKVKVQNDNTALTNVIAQAQSTGVGTSILDGTATLPTLASNATATTTDTVILRHDRLKPFRKDLIVWSVTGVPITTGGILVPGDPTATIEEAMPNHYGSRNVPEVEISIDPDSGARVIRTALYIVFKQNATVADVNAVLNAINGRILSSIAGNRVVSVGIPDPGDLPSLYALISNLRTYSAVEIVQTDSPAQPGALPQKDYAANTISYLDHHLAVRGAAAWDARRAITSSSSPPSILVFDAFGNGAPPYPANQIKWASSNLPIESSGFSNNNPEPSGHGYHVVGILSGNFGGSGKSGQVTGMFPSGGSINTYLTGYGVDRQKGTLTGYDVDIIRLLMSIKGNVIINTSMQQTSLMCDPNVDDQVAKEAALKWLTLLRGSDISKKSDLERRFLHSAAAGNNTCISSNASDITKQKGKYVYGWAAATLLPQDLLEVPPLENTLVVENRMVKPAQVPIDNAMTSCTYDGRYTNNIGASYVDGNVAAIGSRDDSSTNSGVWSYTDALNAPNAGGKLGTSMAAPQVAGLAAYLWTLRPSLTSEELVKRIISHARPPSACSGTDRSATPVIDAYATILSADVDFTDAPARKAILNVNDSTDGIFDAADTELFLNAYFLDANLNPNPSPGILVDYSRYDLNGDGRTGGLGTEQINLDMSTEKNTLGMSTGKSTLNRNPKTDKEYSLGAHENAITDFQALCFYVNSGLFKTSDLPVFESQLNNIRLITGDKTISCTNVLGAKVTISDSLPGWAGLPGESSIGNLIIQNKVLFSVFGNSTTCGSGERGGPIFSSQVPNDAVFFGAKDSFNIPYPTSRGPSNRRNCSSFLAYRSLGGPTTEQIWVNATARRQAFGGLTYDDEYQVRFYSGDPAVGRSDKSCVIGASFNKNNFATALANASCGVEILYGPAQ